ncbi:MAG TPA: hypothetical protein VES65_07800 [Solirubrobacteraceae bacterium]|nr:hypothetical protein [Solirubrobacteraceae bacterium]
MDAWTFIWLMVFLKIPIVALFLIVRWAVMQTPETEPEQDGGVGPRAGRSPIGPRHPHHPRARLPRPPRRGAHGDPSPTPPTRVRTLAARGRLVQR